MNDEPKALTLVEDSPLSAPAVDSQHALEITIKRAERYMELQDQIRKMAIKVTNVNDWVDQNGTPYLEWTGAAKIRSAFGVEVSDVTIEREAGHDEHGDYVVYHATGTIKWQGRSIVEIGTGSSRDKFFGMRNREWLPLQDVDLTNVKKKAHTNLLNRGIKSLLGLSFTWGDIEQYSGGAISRGGTASVEYKKPQGRTAPPATQKPKPQADDATINAQRDEIWQWCIAMNNEDPVTAGDYLQLMTRSKDQPDKFPGVQDVKKLTAGQINWLYPKIKSEYERIQANATNNS